MKRLSISTSTIIRVATLATVLTLSACSTTRNETPDNMPVDKLYAQAKEEAGAGSFEQAIKLYEKLEGRAAGSLLAQQAMLEQAYLHHRNGDKAQALSVLERFSRVHPSSPATDYALYLRGIINFNDNLGLLAKLANQDLSERDQQASKEAYAAFKELIERFPTSRYAEDARARINYVIHTLADYEVHVARYYFRRGMYLSAVNRAQVALQDYPNSPATEEALAIMREGYAALDLPQLSQDANRVLQKSYPQSAYANAKYSPKKSSWWKLW